MHSALQALLATCVPDSEEYVACINAIQPTRVLLQGESEAPEPDELLRPVPVNSRVSVVGGDVLLRMDTQELYPLAWFWSGAHGELLSPAVQLGSEPSAYRIPLPERRWVRRWLVPWCVSITHSLIDSLPHPDFCVQR